MRLSQMMLVCYLNVAAAISRVLVPAYFYPGSLWDMMEEADGIAIMNPNNGPGDAIDTNYVSAVQNAQNAGLLVVGYVYTSYATREISAVEADVDAYFSYYNVDGIFFDETTYSVDYIPYYTTISNYVRSKGPNLHVTLNPGMYPHVAYLSIANLTVVFEGSYHTYLKGFSMPSWALDMDEMLMAHLVYDASKEDMLNAYNASCVRNAGYIYVTNDQLSNPWNTLPSYWTDEVITLSRDCAYSEDARKNVAAMTPYHVFLFITYLMSIVMLLEAF